MIGRYKRAKDIVEFNIDFSKISVKGYDFHKSTYKKGIISALITPKNASLISECIPIYKQIEKAWLRNFRLIVDGKKDTDDLDGSLLYNLYCNGCTTGFKKIDKENNKIINNVIDNLINIKESDLVDISDICINRYTKNLHNPKEKPSADWSIFDFWEYFIELGKREGAIIRGLLNQQEQKHIELSEYSSISLQLKTNLTDKQREKLYALLIADEFISKDTDKEGFVWILGGGDKEHTGFKITWLVNVYFLIDLLRGIKSDEITLTEMKKRAKLHFIDKNNNPININGYKKLSDRPEYKRIMKILAAVLLLDM
jgi:hypothetical protein